MNLEQYNQLTNDVKAIAAECYIDGYKAAITLVESITIRTGDPIYDDLFIANKTRILRIMNEGYKTLQESK